MAWSFYNSSGQLIDGVLDDTVTTAKIANKVLKNKGSDFQDCEMDSRTNYTGRFNG